MMQDLRSSVSPFRRMIQTTIMRSESQRYVTAKPLCAAEPVAITARSRFGFILVIGPDAAYLLQSFKTAKHLVNVKIAFLKYLAPRKHRGRVEAPGGHSDHALK